MYVHLPPADFSFFSTCEAKLLSAHDKKEGMRKLLMASTRSSSKLPVPVIVATAIVFYLTTNRLIGSDSACWGNRILAAIRW